MHLYNKNLYYLMHKKLIIDCSFFTLALVAVYICYVSVVVVSRYIYMKTKKGKDSQKENASTSSTELSTISENIEKRDEDPEAYANDIDFKRTKNLSNKSQRAQSLQEGEVVLTSKLYLLLILS